MMIRELYYSQRIPFSIEDVERRAAENPSLFRRTRKKAESNCKGDSIARGNVLWIACHLFDLAPYCHYCGQVGNADSLTLDHFNPRSKPGTSIAIDSAGIEYRKHEANHPWNIVWACGHCNKLKGNLCRKDFQRVLDDPVGFFRESRYSAKNRERLRAFAEIYYHSSAAGLRRTTSPQLRGCPRSLRGSPQVISRKVALKLAWLPAWFRQHKFTSPPISAHYFRNLFMSFLGTRARCYSPSWSVNDGWMYTPDMEKTREIELRTKGYSFSVEVFEDGDKGEFVAKLIGFTPPLAQQTAPGEGVTYMKHTDEEEVRDTNQESLVERCRKRIREIDGEILTERKL